MYIPISPFTLDERSNPEADVETLCLDFLYEPHQVISSTEIILCVTQHLGRKHYTYNIWYGEFNYWPLQVLAHADSKTHKFESHRPLLL
jgi:hypothetical protein